MILRAAAVLIFVLASGPALAAPDKSILRAQEGAAALLRGKFEQAIALYDEALKEPNLPPARLASLYNDRGVAKWRLDQLEAALVDFNKAIEVYPQYAALYNNRGNVLLDLERPDDAVKDFDRAIALSPAYGAAYNNRGNANHALGRHEQANADYRRAMELMPGQAAPYNGRGKAQGALGRPFTALRYLTRALTLSGSYQAAYRNRAYAYLHLERYEPAIADFDRCITLAPSDAELYVGRGKAWAKLGKAATAAKDFTKAIELDPENAQAYAERGALGNQRRQFEQALEDLNQAVALDAELADAYVHRAETHLRLGDVEAASADLAKALGLDPDYAEAFQIKGEIEEGQGRIDAALAAYGRAVELDPFLDGAKTALKRLTGVAPNIAAGKLGEGVGGWEVISPAQGRYVAVNAKFPKIKLVLEMHGAGAPKLLEWTPLKDLLRGVGLLRYDAGPAPDGKPNEYIVIVDTARSEVVSIEPYLMGDAKAKWDWTENAVTIADAEGIVSAYELRRPRPKEPQYDDPWGGYSGWGYGGGRKRRGGGPFDWLFQ